MKKIKYILPGLAIPALALSLLGVGVASANGGMINFSPEDFAKHHQTMFENQATLLGISASELKDSWAQGKKLQDIAKEKGISEADLKAKMDAQRKQNQQDRLKALVTAGVITQAQADQRLKFQESRPQGMHGKGPGKMGMPRHGGQVN